MNELKHFGNSMSGPDEDVCQTCGNESNTMFWRNGVCQSCQENKSNTYDITKPFLKFLTMMMFLVAIVDFLLNIVTLGFYAKWTKGKTLMMRLGQYIILKEIE